MKRLGIVLMVMLCWMPAVALRPEILVRRSDLIVVAEATVVVPAVKVIPATGWYRKLPTSKQMVLGALRLKVHETLKGLAPKGPLLAVFATRIFVEDMKRKQTSTMTDFPKFSNDILGKRGLWCLKWDKTAKSYRVRNKSRLLPLNQLDSIKDAIKADMEDAPATVSTDQPEPREGWGKLRPDILEGVVKSIDTEKGLMVIEVPKIPHPASLALEGEWSLVLPQWFYGQDSSEILSAEDLRKGDKVRVVTRPGEGEDIRERNAVLVSLARGKPMARLARLLESVQETGEPEAPAEDSSTEEKEIEDEKSP